MKHRVTYAATCFQGLIRRNNEDNLLIDGYYLPVIHIDTEKTLSGTLQKRHVAIFDGVGGSDKGEFASFCAARKFESIFEETADIQKGTEALNNYVVSSARKHRCMGMACTMCAIRFDDKKIYAFNLGDSRIYRLSGMELTQISVDHTIDSPYMQGAITQYLGVPDSEFVVQPSVCELEYVKGDLFLLCTDGLTKMVGDRKLREILCQENTPEWKVERLKDIVLKKGAEDNATIVLCQVET